MPVSGYDAPQLFNLDDDPEERHDRAAVPANREQQEALLALATADWDGTAILTTLERRRQGRPLPSPAAGVGMPRASEFWVAPAGCNVFPEDPPEAWEEGLRRPPRAIK